MNVTNFNPNAYKMLTNYYNNILTPFHFKTIRFLPKVGMTILCCDIVGGKDGGLAVIFPSHSLTKT